jgi:hypothetical protein
MRGWLPPLIVFALAGCSARPPAVDADPTVLLPQTRIVHPDIDECSGIAFDGDAFWVHNDSGAGPILYRSESLDFAHAEALPVAGATAIDWEEITTDGDHLLVLDIGDNRRQRTSCTIYRVHYRDEALDLVATYPFRYPDGAHDAEAAAVIDGKLHIITKDRGEGAALVFRFDDLRDIDDLPHGDHNVPTLAGRLDLGEFEQVTAAAYDDERRRLVLLTYAEIASFDADHLSGEPVSRTRIWARQAEALCFGNGTLVIANEERDVFTVDDFLARAPTSLVPPRKAIRLPAEGRWGRVPVQNLGGDEQVRWRRDDDTLVVELRLRTADPQPTTAERRGSQLLLLFGTKESRRPGPDHMVLSIGHDAVGQLFVQRVRVDEPGSQLDAAPGVTVTGRSLEGRLDAEVRIARETLFPGEEAPGRGVPLEVGWPATFLFDLQAIAVHGNGPEPYFSALGIYSIYRPYTWGTVTVDVDPG